MSFRLRFAAFAPGVDCVIVGGTNVANVDRNVTAVHRGPLPTGDTEAGATSVPSLRPAVAWPHLMNLSDHTREATAIDVAPESPRLEPGTAQILGANWTGRGTNFAVFSANAERVELCLFDADGRSEVARLELPARTGDVWHGFLPARFGGPGLLYGYRVHGPYDPQRGHRFNGNKLLVDPCALAIQGEFRWDPSLLGAEITNDAVASPTDSAACVPKGRVVDDAFDWGKGHAPNVPWRDTIIYEVHVKGFTQRHPQVPEHLRGKYLGLAHPASSTT